MQEFVDRRLFFKAASVGSLVEGSLAVDFPNSGERGLTFRNLRNARHATARLVRRSATGRRSKAFAHRSQQASPHPRKGSSPEWAETRKGLGAKPESPQRTNKKRDTIS